MRRTKLINRVLRAQEPPPKRPDWQWQPFWCQYFGARSERPRKLPRLQLRRLAKPRSRLERRGALSRPDSPPPPRPNGRRPFLRSAEPAGKKEAQGTLEQPQSSLICLRLGT
jgi:hypothetical protein